LRHFLFVQVNTYFNELRINQTSIDFSQYTFLLFSYTPFGDYLSGMSFGWFRLIHIPLYLSEKNIFINLLKEIFKMDSIKAL